MKPSSSTAAKLCLLLLLTLGACGEETDKQAGPVDANTSGNVEAGLSSDAGAKDALVDAFLPPGPAGDASALMDAVVDASSSDAAPDAQLTPITVDFEVVNGVTPGAISGQVAAASRLSDQLQTQYGVTFRSAEKPYVALVRLGAGHATSGTNGIGSVNAADAMAYSTMTITFTVPGNPSVPAVTDQVSLRGDRFAAAGTASMEAFDVNQVSLGKVTVSDVSGGLVLVAAKPNIHSITLTQGSNTIAFDDLVFNPLRAAN